MEFYREQLSKHTELIENAYNKYFNNNSMMPLNIIYTILIYNYDEYEVPHKLVEGIPQEIMNYQPILRNPKASFMILNMIKNIPEHDAELSMNSSILLTKAIMNHHNYTLSDLRSNPCLGQLYDIGDLKIDKQSIRYFSKNKSMFHLLDGKFLKKKYIKCHLTNPLAAEFIEEHCKDMKIHPKVYSNPGLIPYIETWVEKHFKDFCRDEYDKKYSKNKRSIRYGERYTYEYPSEIFICEKYKIKYHYSLENRELKRYLSSNPGAVEFLKKYPKYIDSRYIATNLRIMDIFGDENLQYVDFKWLCHNPNAMDIIENRINLYQSNNYNLHDLFKNVINFRRLCSNEKAIDVILFGIEYMDTDLSNYFDILALNPGIFEVDMRNVKKMFLQTES